MKIIWYILSIVFAVYVIKHELYRWKYEPEQVICCIICMLTLIFIVDIIRYFKYIFNF